jgi:hypothetical protein
LDLHQITRRGHVRRGIVSCCRNQNIVRQTAIGVPKKTGTSEIICRLDGQFSQNPDNACVTTHYGPSSSGRDCWSLSHGGPFQKRTLLNALHRGIHSDSPARGRVRPIAQLLLSDNRQNRQGYAALFPYSLQEGGKTSSCPLTCRRA